MTMPTIARGPESRLAWALYRAPFASRRARLRGFWHYILRRYPCEICMRCGRPVGPHTGSWWLASDSLWEAVIVDPRAVVCPPCFTAAADGKGIQVRWVVVVDHSAACNDHALDFHVATGGDADCICGAP